MFVDLCGPWQQELKILHMTLQYTYIAHIRCNTEEVYISIHTACMYVCMYVRIYVYTYMYVRTYAITSHT